MSKPSLKIVIADDEPLARQRLRDLLADIGQVDVVGEAQHGEQALLLVQETQADAILLDIRMPHMDGIEAAQHMQHLNPRPHIIFTTAYDNYAIQAFELNAIDYLLKPIREERLATALDKVRKTKQPLLNATQLQSIKPLQSARTHLSIHVRGRVVLVPLHQVIYLRAEQKYITVRTANDEHLLEGSLSQLEDELGQDFVRVHRNCLVAKAHIHGFEKQSTQTDEGLVEHHWVVRFKGISDTVAVSRRHQHIIKTF